MYVNGVRSGAAVAQTKNPVMGLYPLCIGDGGDCPSTWPWTGPIDHVAVWTRALSEVAIRDLYLNPFCFYQSVPLTLWTYSTAADPLIVSLNVSDRANLTDNLDKYLPVLYLSVGDTALIPDSVSAVISALKLSGYDSLTASDLVTAILTLKLNAYDSATVSDLAAVLGTALKLSASDEARLTDSLAAIVSALTLSASDVATLTDNLLVSIFGGVTLNVADVMVATDSSAQTISAVLLATSETVLLSDVLAGLWLNALFVNAYDAATLADGVTPNLRINVIGSDVVVINDVGAFTFDGGAITCNVSDFVSLSDAMNAIETALKLDANDSATIGDLRTITILGLARPWLKAFLELKKEYSQ